MPPQEKLIRLGFHGNAWEDRVERRFQGLLRAVTEDARLAIADCRLTPVTEDLEHSSPPWTGKVDGTIAALGLSRTKTKEELIEWIQSGGAPVVTVAADLIDPRIVTVCLDPTSIAELAAEHLLASGCRRFIHVGFDHSMGSEYRADAFRKVLIERGYKSDNFDFTTKFIQTTPSQMKADEGDALASMLAKGPHPVGVLSLSDPVARVVLDICKEHELDVPNQVAVMGVDNLPTAIQNRPTISSIDYPGEEVGYRAARLLAKIIDGGPRPRKPVYIKVKNLVARESTVGKMYVDDSFAQALELIQRRACHGLSTRDLVEALPVSRRWLEQEFQKNIGRSPLQEINRIRLATAKRLLQTTELPVGQIADMIGFSAQAGLTNFFQKHTKLSPTEFRSWIRSDAPDS